MRLVWSQPGRRSDARTLLLVSVLCLFLGGVVVGAGGRELREAPRPVRAAIASLLSTGGVLFFFGVVLLAVRKSRGPGRTRLTLADPDASAVAEAQRHFGQEERR